MEEIPLENRREIWTASLDRDDLAQIIEVVSKEFPARRIEIDQFVILDASEIEAVRKRIGDKVRNGVEVVSRPVGSEKPQFGVYLYPRGRSLVFIADRKDVKLLGLRESVLRIIAPRIRWCRFALSLVFGLILSGLSVWSVISNGISIPMPRSTLFSYGGICVGVFLLMSAWDHASAVEVLLDPQPPPLRQRVFEHFKEQLPGMIVGAAVTAFCFSIKYLWDWLTSQ